jgi:hypothetical protein
MAHLFNGTNDSLEVGSAPVTAVPLTIVAWIYPQTDNAGTVLSIGANAATPRFQLYYNNATSQRAAALTDDGTSSSVADSSGIAPLNQWSHVAAVFTSATSRVAYFNGVAGAENTVSRVPTGINRLNIGARYNPSLGGFFNGALAEVAVYNAALTASEVLSLSKRYRPDRIRPQNLVYLDRLIRTPQDLRGGRLITQLGTGTTPSPHPAILFP